jgi:hypothetical protein
MTLATEDVNTSPDLIRHAFARAGEPKHLLEVDGAITFVYPWGNGRNVERVIKAAREWFAEHFITSTKLGSGEVRYQHGSVTPGSVTTGLRPYEDRGRSSVPGLCQASSVSIGLGTGAPRPRNRVSKGSEQICEKICRSVSRSVRPANPRDRASPPSRMGDARRDLVRLYPDWPTKLSIGGCERARVE